MKTTTDTAAHTPEHLNSAGLRIAYTESKGRGVFATREIDAHVVIEISPVLLFTSDEYESHGKHTIVDHYTFNWRDGRFALALGLGSIFNHSQTPNVSYTLDRATESIKYTTTRRITAGEELCIFYGHKLWFDLTEASAPLASASMDEDDGWGGLSSLSYPPGFDSQVQRFEDGRLDDVISEDDLPFTRIKLLCGAEEEELDTVRTEEAWVVDIPSPTQTTAMLKWLKQSGLETPSMSHLKRVRRSGSTSSILLAFSRSCISPPSLPVELQLPEPYLVMVPSAAALTLTSLKLKTTFWPTMYAPRRKGDTEDWSRGKVLWALEAIKHVVFFAQQAREHGELPIAAYVPIPYEETTQAASQAIRSFTAHDMRNSALHPLRHAVLNVVRAVADYRAAYGVSGSMSQSAPCATSPTTDVSASDSSDDAPRNGAHYLLTSLTLFTTHEPCIMCSMALLHSRVKEVYYLIPMDGTGGCGGAACVPRLSGVNHRFGIGKWHVDSEWIEGSRLKIAEDVDA